MNLFSRLKFLPLGLFTVCFGPAPISAASLCQTGNLSSYISLNTVGGCTIGDVTFFRFDAPTPSVTGGAGFATASDILVTPISSSAGVGFAFSAMSGNNNLFSIPNPTQAESATYYINYS